MAHSNEPSIELMNEAIALFMGLKPRLVQPPDPALHCIEVWYNNESQPMKYHTSWDWLMPVVEKIAKTVSMLEAPKNDYELDAFEIIRRPIYTAISTIHNDVYQFITWLNQQKQTNEQ